MIMLSFLLSTCTYPPSLLEQIKHLGELRVVTRNTPATFYYGTDEPRGIEYDLARGFAERLGVELRIYNADQYQEILPDVALGKAHLAAAGLTTAAAGGAQVEFGPVYQTVRQEVVYRRGMLRPGNLEDLMGSRLEVVAGSAYAGSLRAARAWLPDLSWKERPDASAEQLIRSVASGEIDYTIVDSSLFDLLRHFYPDVQTAFTLGPQKQVAWALPKMPDNSLRESVSAYFAEISASGELQHIMDRYYYSGGELDYVGARAFLRHFDIRLPRYRASFREASLATGADWRLLAAIAYQESHWNPAAVSPTGVAGMMMLTERTAKMMGVSDRRDARQSILGGAQYFGRVQNKIPLRITDPDRTWFTVAAYNIGYGHLEDARVLTEMQGGDPDRWADVRERLPLLSEEKWYRRVPRGYARGSVPVMYVENVRRYYDLLLWMTSGETVLTEEHPPAADAPAG
jgi:membrane-bound lytic murein transglycosylase F